MQRMRSWRRRSLSSTRSPRSASGWGRTSRTSRRGSGWTGGSGRGSCRRGAGGGGGASHKKGGGRVARHGGDGGAAQELLPGIDIVADAASLAEGADALVLVTEWEEFSLLEYRRMRERMRTPVFVDGRNLLNRDGMRDLGFDYVGIGR